MADLPSRRSDPPNLPAERRLTQEQFELVIRRASEMQARAAEEGAGPPGGLTEAEAIRIGREIGISPENMRRALAETGVVPVAAPKLPERLLGPGWVRASRTVPGDATFVRTQLDRYLVNRENLAPVRRFHDRTQYGPARGGELARILQMTRELLDTARKQPLVGAGYKLRRAAQVEVAVQPLEEGYSHVTLAADLSNRRTEAALIGGSLGGSAGVVAAALLGVAIDPIFVLSAFPLFGAGMGISRMAHVKIAEHAQTHLESILDSLERGERLVLGRS